MELVRWLDPDSITSVALAHARRHIRCKFPSLLIPPDQVSLALVAGENLGQSVRGMIKMYKAELLGKLPVVRHFLFGSILPYNGWPPSASSDCYGIPVPSAFPAANQDAARQPRAIEGPGILPVPFD